MPSVAHVDACVAVMPLRLGASKSKVFAGASKRYPYGAARLDTPRSRLKMMLTRYSFVFFALAGGVAAFVLTLMPASTRVPLGRSLFADDSRARGMRLTTIAPAAPTAWAPTSVPPSARPNRGPSRRQVEWGVAALLGRSSPALSCQRAIVLRDGKSANAATPCENFGHAQSLLAGIEGTEGAPTAADRILSDEADGSTRIMQLRSMFDRCYYWAKG